MLTISFIIICLIFRSNSVSGFSASGKHFVAACPWIRGITICNGLIATTEKKAEVSVSKVNDEGVIYGTKKHTVTRGSPVEFELGKCNQSWKCFLTEPNPKYHVRVFKSAEQFRVLVITRGGMESEFGIFLLTPKRSCSLSYYTVTATGDPFIAIFAFDYEESVIEIEFPAMKTVFETDCDSCQPGKTVHLSLFKYESWFFTQFKDDVLFPNVRITSNLPVHVMSGSAEGSSGSETSTKGFSISSLKPTKSWGKLYIVPRIATSPLILSISALSTPLKIEFHERASGKLKTRDHTFSSFAEESFTYGLTSNIVAVSADAPFGLYQLFSGPAGVSVLNLNPVELWTKIIYYVHVEIADCTTNYHLITQARREDVYVSPTAEGDNVIQWQTSQITIKRVTYSVAKLKLSQKKDKIYVNSVSGGIILYISTSVMKDGKAAVGSLAAYSYDFHLAEIYQEDCKTSDAKLNDGIDNDCDNTIDEELVNKIDDDGDGLVDEDTVKLYSDGQWTKWTFACQHLCNEAELSVMVRLCKNRSSDGRDCEGERVQCDEKPCPDSCGESDCFCGAGCVSCSANIFQCQEGCKSGFKNTEHCLEPCPVGWTGIDCKTREETKNNRKKSDPSVWYIVPILLVYNLVVSTVWSLIVRRRPQPAEELDTAATNGSLKEETPVEHLQTHPKNEPNPNSPTVTSKNKKPGKSSQDQVSRELVEFESLHRHSDTETESETAV